MGVKSTVTLDRDEAERRGKEYLAKGMEFYFQAQVDRMSDSELEYFLERENDNEHGGEGYENYSIREE